jgi:hypothetical protein
MAQINGEARELLGRSKFHESRFNARL